MSKNCPRCDTKLQKTFDNRDFCPNCGIIEKDMDIYVSADYNQNDVDQFD